MANNLFQQLNQVQNNNPQIQQIMNLVKQSGMTPKDLFYQKSREMGIDPNSIISQLSQFGK